MVNENNMPDTLVEYLASLKASGVPDNKLHSYAGAFFEMTARKKAIPLHGTFELTPLCNLDCKMCYVHLNNQQFHTNELIDVKTWNGFIDQAYELGMRTATLTGGECFTYPGFDDIYMHLYEKSIHPGIMTNGLLLNEKKVGFLKEFPPRRIQITLYGSNNEAYERVTGYRVFDTVIHNISLVHDAGLPLVIAITPNKFMWNDVDSLLNLVENMGIPYFLNSHLSTPRENTGRDKHDLTIEQYISLYKKANALKQYKDLLEMNPEEMPEPGHGTENGIGLRCGAGRSTFDLRYDGTMSPCVSLNYITSNPMKDGLEMAWKQINRAVNAYILPVECGDCFYRAVCAKCITVHHNDAKKGHCNPAVCERTIKMISAGLIPLPVDN